MAEAAEIGALEFERARRARGEAKGDRLFLFESHFLDAEVLTLETVLRVLAVQTQLNGFAHFNFYTGR